MKYVIIIPDGAADHPLAELDGKTAFEAARKPHTDRLASQGRQGTVSTTPPGFPCGSDVCSMSLLGYDPARYHKGRAPLEAAALGIPLAPTDWIFRVNLVTIIDGKMQDHSAGHITSDEGAQLLADFATQIDIEGMTLYPGVSYRNIMVDSSNTPGEGDTASTPAGRDWAELQTTPPHDIPGEPIKKHLPVGGPNAALLQKMIEVSGKFYEGHEINQTRKELGELPATHLWPWGQGQKPSIPTFESRFGLKGAMITAVDLLAGIASFIGWDRLDVPGQTSYHDTDYAAAGRHAIAALDNYDIVCVHVESPDEASHAADPTTKTAAIEAIDEHIVGPIHAELERRSAEWGGYRVLYLPDHYTAAATRKHDPTPVPFAICGTRIHSVLQRPFNEKNSREADLHIKFGHELMEYFLFSGLS
ncbi:MAG: cofactor-independent phosphoglycerate mutase [Planctomycetota bacterium]|nr:cofactor-independent phosphoglycerate mutase [Planctomycetota bacterium]